LVQAVEVDRHLQDLVHVRARKLPFHTGQCKFKPPLAILGVIFQLCYSCVEAKIAKFTCKIPRNVD
jgi:hypothetical protein